MSHEAWDELAAGHAVNALEPEEEHAFREHLRGCAQCRETLASMEEVAGQVGYAAEAIDPPDALKRRILDAAAAERPAVFGKTPPGVIATPSARRKQPRVWQPTFRVATLAAAAAVVVAAGMAVWNFSLRGDNSAQQAALERRTAALHCLAVPETPKFQLASGSGQRAKTCLAGSRAYVVVDRLDRNGPDSVYVLWWLDAQRQAHAVERFDVGITGTAVYELPLDATPADVRSMAISLEPSRALPAAPSRVVASGAAVPD